MAMVIYGDQGGGRGDGSDAFHVLIPVSAFYVPKHNAFLLVKMFKSCQKIPYFLTFSLRLYLFTSQALNVTIFF